MIRRAVSLAGVLLVLTVSPAAKAGVCPASPGTSRLVEEQAALNRVAVTVATETAPQRVFDVLMLVFAALAAMRLILS